MTPTITYLATQAHIDDLRREAEHRGAVEARVRQMLRRAPPRQTVRRPHMIPAATHH
jgi:hypothetical protein